jgi:hypothetical protein
MTGTAVQPKRRIVDSRLDARLDRVLGEMGIDPNLDLSSGISPSRFHRSLEMYGEDGLGQVETAARGFTMVRPPKPGSPERLILMDVPPDAKGVVFFSQGAGGRTMFEDPRPGFLEKLYDTLKSAAFYGIMKSIPIDPGKGVLGGIKGSFEELAKQNFEGHMKNNFSWLYHHYMFSQGSSTITNYLTVEFERGGRKFENPVFINSRKSRYRLADMDINKLAIECIKDPMASDTINETVLSESYSDAWIESEAEISFTNSDIKNVKDPNIFRNRLTRADLYLMQQSGPILQEISISPAQLPPGVTKAKIKKYGDPGWLKKLMFHSLGSLVYNVADAPYNLFVTPLIGSSRTTGEAYLKGEADASMKITRSIWQPRKPLEHYT